MEKEKEKQMIEHISPFYTVAIICAVALILVILAGFAMIDWPSIWASLKRKDDEEFDPEWMDFDKWEQSK